MDVSKVTIGICTHNTKALTLANYRIIRRFYPTIQVIIFDDGSTDGTYGLLVDQDAAAEHKKKYNRRVDLSALRVLRSNKGIGHGPGMNRIIQAANTRYVLFLDSDTFILSDQLVPSMLKVFEQHPDAYGVGRAYQTVPRFGKVVHLAPWFMMINQRVWWRYAPFENSGIPTRPPMEQIEREGKSDELLIDIEGVCPKDAREEPYRNLLKGLAVHAVQVTEGTSK